MSSSNIAFLVGALEKAGVAPEDVDACYMGNVCSAGLGQAPARQAALGAGLSSSCVCTTINKVCSSGMKSVSLAAQDIMLGHADIVVAGGMESMSNVPYYIPQARFGYRMGNAQLVDGLVYDGLFDPYGQEHMGLCAEKCSSRYSISREEQDEYALKSYRRSIAAWKESKFNPEIVPVLAKVGEKDINVQQDEECFRIDLSTIRAMRPAFVKDGTGTVTSGNASGLNDGAAALVLTSRARAIKLGLPILATIRAFADAEQDPEQFTTAPSKSIPKAMERAGVRLEAVDVFEVNEAFSVVALANSQLLALPEEKLNVFGGAVSLGHPLGCSGARILVTMLNIMNDQKARIGVAGICNGGGGSTAVVLERQTVSNSASL